MYLRKYETITLVDPTKGSDGVNKVLERMREALAKTDAKEIRFEDWGRRKTAYTLQSYKVDRAHYLYLQYLANNSTVHELERLMKITEEAMMYQTILLEDRVVADSFDFEAAAVEETATINRGEDADAPFVVEAAPEPPAAEEVVEAAPKAPAAEKAVEAAPEEPAAEKAVEAAPEEPAAEEAAPEEPAAEEAVEVAAEEPAAEEAVEAAAEEPAAEEAVEAAAEEPAAEEAVEAAAEEPAAEEAPEAAADEAAEATTDDDAKSE